MIYLEILSLLALGALQFFYFTKNRENNSRVKNYYPEEKNLAIDRVSVKREGYNQQKSFYYNKLLEGAVYSFVTDPTVEYQVVSYNAEGQRVKIEKRANGEEVETLSLNFNQLRELSDNEDLVFKDGELNRQKEQAAKVNTINIRHGGSEDFHQVVDISNEYLLRNRGTADLGFLKEVAHEKYENILYMAKSLTPYSYNIGLLGAFFITVLGVFAAIMTRGIINSVEVFLTGLGLGILSGLLGLAFTLLSRQELRTARAQANERRYQYLNFLRVELLPELQVDLSSSLSSLKRVVEEFNQDFFRRFVDFNDSFKNLTKYLDVQERFVKSLEGTGYSKIAEANIQFLDKIKENEELFSAFVVYQKKLNESIQLGRDAASDIRYVLERLKHIDNLQTYIEQNGELLRKQLGYLSVHQEKMEQITNSIRQYFVEAGDELGDVVRKRLEILKREEQDAGEELRLHFDRLKQENVYQKIADQLHPIQIMEQQVESLRESFDALRESLLDTQKHIMYRISQDGRVQSSLLNEVKELNKHMAQLNEKKTWFQRVFGTK